VLDEMQQLLAASDGPLGALLALREQVSVCEPLAPLWIAPLCWASVCNCNCLLLNMQDNTAVRARKSNSECGCCCHPWNCSGPI
jgi:hypothetical protein